MTGFVVQVHIYELCLYQRFTFRFHFYFKYLDLYICLLFLTFQIDI